MTITEYINEINKEYKTGRATEHSYRGYLQNLIKSIATNVMVTNEPTRVKCGAPDYIITKRDIPVGYIEAKDIGCKLDDKVYKEQFDRYRKSLTNLIITDYIDFWLYIDGELIKKVRIAEVNGSSIKPLPEHHTEFTNLVKDFCTYVGQTIKSSKKLAEMMAGKARMLSEVIEKSLVADEADTLNPDTPLQAQLHAFKDILIHDITPKEFADIYAQTIAYGMFAARLHDPTLPTFSRQEAAELIPKTNPFLRKLFQYIAGYDLDQRLVWIVDGLAEIFRATDVAALLKNFGKSTQTNDPIIHFYETFLTEYDPALRKARGVWYTPEPVVNFIVRAVDDTLKKEFSLKDGLADTSKTKIKIKIPTHDKRFKAGQVDYEQEFHKVQILDPATGTGTFLAEVVKNIYNKFKGQQGIWSKYVDEHLVPRLNGFELLMASYAMAHLKLDMLLTETGYKQSREQRFKIYLTNSLEEHHPDTGTLFANWLSAEANEANHIKRDSPVMVVLGNPPYSGISSNNGEWIGSLIENYKYVDGVHFNERKHWLNDDYVKFIRYGQHFIEKNGSGILAFINPHGFLSNPTFRGMRWNLLKAFDCIYTIDLHGNSNKKETSPDGSVDVNVFDIQQGVSINVLIKTGKKKTDDLAEVFHHDVFGKREIKYEFLLENSIKSIPFKKLKPEQPYFFFVESNNDLFENYNKGFHISKLFLQNSVGFVSANDGLNISFSKEEQVGKIRDLLEQDEAEWRKNYKRPKDARDWTYPTAKNDAVKNQNSNKYTQVLYRPFDIRWTLYTGNSRGLYSSPQPKIMNQFLNHENLGLVTARSNKSETCDHFFISKNIMETKCGERTTQSAIFPLYIYPEKSKQHSIDDNNERTPNLNLEIINQIAEKLHLTFTNEKQSSKKTFSPIDVFDYIYSVLHSATYREHYREFLKVDFPRVPFPTNAELFWRLVQLGGRLRQVHLLEGDSVTKYVSQYPIDGDNVVGKVKYADNKVFINDTQYFSNVLENVWEFYIGGYQPAQKWLKDRKERELSIDDILHYQKIIVALSETIRLMNEIDKIQFID